MESYVIGVVNEDGNTKFLGHDKSRVMAYDNPFTYPILFKSFNEAEKSSSFYTKHLSFKVLKVFIMKLTTVQAGEIEI